jgi:hypothetical protein
MHEGRQGRLGSRRRLAIARQDRGGRLRGDGVGEGFAVGEYAAGFDPGIEFLKQLRGCRWLCVGGLGQRRRRQGGDQGQRRGVAAKVDISGQ